MDQCFSEKQFPKILSRQYCNWSKTFAPKKVPGNEYRNLCGISGILKRLSTGTMFKEILSTEAIPVIESLAPHLEMFYLGGGSGLALQLFEKELFLE